MLAFLLPSLALSATYYMTSENTCFEADVSGICQSAAGLMGLTTGTCAAQGYTTSCGDSDQSIPNCGSLAAYVQPTGTCPSTDDLPDMPADMPGEEDFVDIPLDDLDPAVVDIIGEFFTTEEAEGGDGGDYWEMPEDGENPNPDMISEEDWQTILDAVNELGMGEITIPEGITLPEGIDLSTIETNWEGDLINPTDQFGNTMIPVDTINLIDFENAVETQDFGETTFCFDQDLSSMMDGSTTYDLSCTSAMTDCSTTMFQTFCPETCDTIPESCDNSSSGKDGDDSAGSLVALFSIAAAALLL